jgi:hypothetical protein
MTATETARCRYSFGPGTYNHECGKPATHRTTYEHGFQTTRCEAHKDRAEFYDRHAVSRSEPLR